ncbi:hypothetical protein C8R44DRAFT_825108 [Mycena epipterygia]|nr:hypothetical protein C8R44DRAFT_825108 [Mycena epipterygia]
MHPALQLSRLDRLPPAIRRTASAAARGSAEHLKRLEARLREIPDLEQLLPVFYANLDPQYIPSGDQLDIPTIFTDDGVVCRASISLTSLFSIIGIPLPVFQEIWPALWKWMLFLDAFRDHLPESVDVNIGTGFLLFAGGFGRSKDIMSIMSSTTGFRRMLARAWVLLLRPGNRVAPVGFEALTMTLLIQMKVANRKHVEEVIEGAGGTLSDLAFLVIAYIDRVRPDTGPPVRQDSRLHGLLIDFVEDVDKFLADDKVDREALGPFSAALLSAGIIPALTTMVYILTRPKGKASPFPRLVFMSVLFLAKVLPGSAEIRSLANAVKSGLLHVIVACGGTGEVNAALQLILEDALPTSLLYYYNLLIFDEALAAVESLACEPAFRSCAIFDVWTQFTALAAQRLSILSKDQRLKACDNLKCGRIGARISFKRCSGCLASYYCSADCQKIDWSEYHGKSCDRLCSYRLCEMQPFRARERSFLRALLNHDYTASKSLIIQKQALFMATHPGEAFVTLFDYTKGHGQVRVVSAENPIWARYFGGQMQWQNDIARAVRAEGRMELHAMLMRDGADLRCFGIPLRTQTSHMHLTLQRIARYIKVDAPTFPQTITEIEKEICPHIDDLGIH